MEVLSLGEKSLKFPFLDFTSKEDPSISSSVVIGVTHTRTWAWKSMRHKYPQQSHGQRKEGPGNYFIKIKC